MKFQARWHWAVLAALGLLTGDAMADTGGSQVGGGGEVIPRGGRMRLRDRFSGTPRCVTAPQPWSSFSSNFPGFSNRMNRLRRAHHALSVAFESELQVMSFCFVSETLPVVPDSSGTPGRATVAYRNGDRVYIHRQLFGRMTDPMDRFLLAFHEAGHQYFPVHPAWSEEERFERLRQLTAAVDYALTGPSPTSLGDLATVLTELEIDVPARSPELTPSTPHYSELNELLNPRTPLPQVQRAAMLIFVANGRSLEPLQNHPVLTHYRDWLRLKVLQVYGEWQSRLHALVNGHRYEGERYSPNPSYPSPHQSDDVIDADLAELIRLAEIGVPSDLGLCENHPDHRALGLDAEREPSMMHTDCSNRGLRTSRFSSPGRTLYSPGATLSLLSIVASRWSFLRERTARRTRAVLAITGIDPNRRRSVLLNDGNGGNGGLVVGSECFSPFMDAVMSANIEGVGALLDDPRVDRDLSVGPDCLRLLRHPSQSLTARQMLNRSRQYESNFVERYYGTNQVGSSWMWYTLAFPMGGWPRETVDAGPYGRHGSAFNEEIETRWETIKRLLGP